MIEEDREDGHERRDMASIYGSAAAGAQPLPVKPFVCLWLGAGVTRARVAASDVQQCKHESCGNVSSARIGTPPLVNVAPLLKGSPRVESVARIGIAASGPEPGEGRQSDKTLR